MKIVPLGPGFAAELRGIGLAEIAARADIYAAVRAAFEQHSVLLFRGQTVTDDAQLDFTRCFGPLEITKRASLGEGSHFSILTNLDADGWWSRRTTASRWWQGPISSGIPTARPSPPPRAP